MLSENQPLYTYNYTIEKSHVKFPKERRSIIKIYTDESIIKDLSISNNAIAVYCVLRSIIRQEQLDYVVTANQLLFQSTGKHSFTKYDKSSFLIGINELIKREIITNPYSFNNSERVLNLSSIIIPNHGDKKFTTIKLSEIQTVLNNCGANRYSVLRYFILIVGTFHPNISVSLSETDVVSRVISIMPITHFCKISGLSKSTIMSYNKILEDLKLLYIYHAADYYRIDERTIKSPPNVYGRYSDKEYVLQFVKNSSMYHKYGQNNPKEAANHKRRLAQRYNRIISGSHSYTDEEVKEVYDYILAANQKYQSDYEKSKWEPYKEKIRDVSKLESILQKGAGNT